jgi:hypothetical protein
MYKKVLTACAGFVVLLMISGMAFAGVPCAGTTSVVAYGDNVNCAPGAAVCPAGDYGQLVTVDVTVRDCYGTPLAGETVTVTPVGATGSFCFCDSSKVVGPTDALGETSATWNDFGGCGTLTFTATIGTVTAGPSAAITIGSPDNNGDCAVNLVDFGNFASHFLTTTTCSDYNCDGIVDLVDFGNFASHFLHACP